LNGLGNHRPHVVPGPQAKSRLGYIFKNEILIAQLVERSRAPSDLVGGNIRRHGQDRRRAPPGLNQGGRHITGAGTGGGNDHPHPFPGPGVPVGHVGGAGFMPTEDVLNGRFFPQGIVEADIMDAGDAEDMVHP
jgi:hypothetical protein